MALGNTNPIKYSDLISPDDSISNLIKQLDELSDAYINMSKNVREQAGALATNLRGVSGATEAGRKTIQNASTDADRLAKAQKALNDAESETNIRLQELKQAQKEANDIAKVTARLNRSQEGSYNRLAAMYKMNMMHLNTMSREMRENTAAGKKLEAETRAIYEEMKRLQAATGAHQLNVGNYREAGDAVAEYGEKLKATLGLNSNFGEALLALGRNSGEAKSALEGLKGGFAALGKTMLTLATNPVFLAIAGVAAAGAAFKWWYDYNSGLVEATRLTQQFTQLTGSALKDLRDEISGISDTFGTDFRETLQATNSVAKQFGISYEQAADVIRKGFVAGANANGEFIDTLKEYPAYFKEAGISASDFVAIIAKSNQEGIFSDKGVDAIKEGNLRLREMTTATASALEGIGISSKKVQEDLQSGAKTTWQVMQEVSQKLSELPESSSKVGTAIADIFGGPGEDAGLQYLTMLKDIKGGIDDVIERQGDAATSLLEVNNAATECKKAFNNLFDSTGGDFETFTNRLKTGLYDTLTGILITIKEVGAWWKNTFNSMNNALGGFLSSAIKKIAETNSFLAPLIKAYNYFTEKGKSQRESSALLNAGAQAGGAIASLAKSGGGTKTGTQPVQTSGGKTTRRTARKTDAAKALEDAYKAEVSAMRKWEDVKTAAMEDGVEKRQLIITQQYGRQIEDLRHRLNTEKKLTVNERKDINATILQLEKNMQQESAKIYAEYDKKQLERQKTAITLQLDAAKKGSAEELKLKLQQIETQKQIDLAANAALPASQRVNSELITAKYGAQAAETVKGYIPEAKAKTQTEERAKRIAEEQQTITELITAVEAGEIQVGEAQINALRKRSAALTEEARNLTRDYVREVTAEAQKVLESVNVDWSKPIDGTKAIQQLFYDLQDAFSGDQTEDKIKAVAEAFNLLTGALNQAAAARIEEANAAVAQAEKDISSAQQALTYEQQARAAGYANNVALAQKELETARKNEAKALRDRKKAQRQQAAIQTVQQIGNLVTASALIWSQLGFPAAIPAIATMWASFAASKVIAATLTKSSGAQDASETYGDGTVELLQGGSHQSGHDIDLGRKPDGTRRRAEGGEFFAVINKRNSRRFRRVIPDVINSLNDGSFATKYMHSYDSTGLTVNVDASDNLDGLKSDVKRIRETAETRNYTDAEGHNVLEYKNLKRITR